MRAQAVLECNVRIEIFRGDFEEKIEEIQTRNLWVKSGRNKIRDVLMYPDADTSPSPAYTINFIAVGTDGTTTSDSTTALGTEVYRDEITRKIPLDSGLILQLYVPQDQANDNTLRECGIFSAAAGGTLWARATYVEIPKAITISVIYNWTITIAAA